jgi:uncharacterized phage protein gp47/JayE
MRNPAGKMILHAQPQRQRNQIRELLRSLRPKRAGHADLGAACAEQTSSRQQNNGTSKAITGAKPSTETGRKIEREKEKLAGAVFS